MAGLSDLQMVDILRTPKFRARLGPHPALQSFTKGIPVRPAFLQPRKDLPDHVAATDAAQAKGRAFFLLQPGLSFSASAKDARGEPWPTPTSRF